jgi:1-acyl-sn-glycerol-3-phosphate acyltransferase
VLSHPLYLLVKVYVTAALHVYFNKIKVYGKENLKGNGPFLFVANHQNAFMDGVLIVITNSFPVHFLVRADIFKKAWARTLLAFCKLIPVYRIRDGFSSLSKNQEQFDECARLFKKKESVLIFPEGNHAATRSLRPLSKGFTRIAFEAQRQHPEMNLQVVPVGINYSHHRAFNSRVSIYFGKPIPVADYYKEPIPQQANAFKDHVAEEIKKRIAHIDDEARYEEILTKLNASNPDYFSPEETNERIRKIEMGEALPPTVRSMPILYTLFAPLRPLVYLINLPVIFGWRKFSKGIKDKVFITSLKFGYGIFVVQLYYLLIMGVSSIWIGWWCGLVYAGLVGTLRVLRKQV